MKERIKQYLQYKHLSAREFERQCELGNGVLSRLSPTTSQYTFKRIANNSDLNIDWLLTGKGEMLNKKFKIDEIEFPTSEELKIIEADIKEGRAGFIPLVHIDSVGGIHSENSIVSSEQYIERLIPFPDARPGDVAILQSGNSMAPTIPAGAILQIRRVDGWREYFGYGGDFVLWLEDDRRITKQVLKYEPDPKNYITCHSYNPESADEELPKSMIVEVWKVVNVLINKGW